MSFQDELEQLGDNTAGVVMQLWEQYLAGDIDGDAFEDLTGLVIDTANARAWLFGTVAFTGYMAAVTGSPGTVPTTAGYVAQADRLTEAARTITRAPAPPPAPPPGIPPLPTELGPRLQEIARRNRLGLPVPDSPQRRWIDTASRQAGDARQTAETRLTRLARSEPMDKAQRGYGEAIRQDSRTEGWKRGLELDACELCTWWDRDGRIWPKDHVMPTHKGCACVPVPVVGQRVQRVGASARWASDERRAAGGPTATRLRHPQSYSSEAQYRRQLREREARRQATRARREGTR